MRGLDEIKFRVRQEALNVFLLVAKPTYRGSVPNCLALPDPTAVATALKGSPYATHLTTIAEQILAHQLPLFDTSVSTGPQIHWRRDYISGKESAARFFRRLPYLNFEAVGDHKFIWELSRHQHLVLLAQAYIIGGKQAYLDEVAAQLESWTLQNPLQRGINWASALEVAFRALSWIWIFHLAANALPGDVRNKLLTGIYQHGHHLAANLSVYFSPNTHLLGEAVALHAIGTLFPDFPEAATWSRRAAQIVESQLSFQVKPDGSHFEQSTYYHVYALDMFVFYYVLAGRPPQLEPSLNAMAEYLHWLLGPAGQITFFGDDDGGRFFHPYGPRSEFGRASLTTCGLLFNRPQWIGSAAAAAEQAAWWLGAEALSAARQTATPPSGNRIFPDSGTIFLQAGELFVQFDAGPFGWAGAGHSHADALSLTAWHRGNPVFTDPGTFTYIGDATLRNWFRGTAAHNTVCVDSLDQAHPAGPFRWTEKPEVDGVQMESLHPSGFAEATCRFRGFIHRRRLLLNAQSLLVLDEIEGPPGEHLCEQTWQLGPAAAGVSLSFSSPAETEASWISPVYGSKQQTSAQVVRIRGPLPTAIAMLLTTTEHRSITVSAARTLFLEHDRAPAVGPPHDR